VADFEYSHTGDFQERKRGASICLTPGSDNSVYEESVLYYLLHEYLERQRTRERDSNQDAGESSCEATYHCPDADEEEGAL
jgi:hypothetical protein